MSYEDERIVKMTFDHEAFKKGVSETIEALNTLEKSLKNIDAGTSYKSFDKLTDSVNYTDRAFSNVDQSVNKVKASFSAMQVVGMTVLSELTRSAMSFGKTIWNNTLGQIKSGGTARALNIEAAKFQLEGLGVAWDDISEDINYAVQGTAYGLDEAAKAAAQLTASQVKLGDEMKATLRGISGVAAMTNSQYSDIANVFTTVAANGKLMTMQLRQLSARGLNASAVLAEAMGVSEAAIGDMVTKGQISFRQFAEAMDNAFGAHATKANETFTGSLSNMKASLSRMGEAFVTPWHNMEKVIFNAFLPVMKVIEKVVKRVSPMFTEITNQFGAWVEKLAKNEDFLRGILNIVVGVYSWIYNIVKALREAGLELPAVEKIGSALAKVTKVFLLEGDNAIKFRQVIITVVKSFELLVAVIQAAFYAFSPLINLVKDFFIRLANNTNGIRDRLEEAIAKIAVIIRYVGALIAMAIPIVLKAIHTGIKVVIAILGGAAVALLKIGSVLKFVINKVIDFVGNFKENAAVIINNAGVLLQMFELFFKKVKDIFTTLGDGVIDFVDNISSGAKSLGSTIKDMFKERVMQAKVKLTVETPKLDAKSIIQNDATSKISNAASAAKSYASETKNAIKQSKALSGVTGGKYLSGFIGGKEGLGVAQALKEIQQQEELTEEQTKQLEQTMHRMVKSVTDTADKLKVPEETKKEGFFDRILGTMDIEKQSDSFVDKVGTHVKNIASKVKKVFEPMVDALSNVFNVVAITVTAGIGAITVAITGTAIKAVNTVFDVIKMFPEMVSALNNFAKGFKYQGLAEVLKNMLPFFLGFGALLAVIAVISHYADPQAFSTVAKYAALLIAATSLMVQAVSAIMVVAGISKLIKKIPAAPNLKPKSKTMANLTDLLKGVAILLGVIAVGVVGITVAANQLGGYDGIIKSAMILVAIMAAIGVFIALVAKTVGDKATIKNSETIGLMTKFYQKDSVNGFGGVIALIYSLVPLIATIGLSIGLLASQDIDNVTRVFGLTMALIATLMGTIITTLIIFNSSLNRTKGSMARDIGNALKSLMGGMSKVLLSVAVFFIAFIGAAKILDTISWKGQKKYLLMIGGLFGAIILLINGLMIWSSMLLKQAGSEKKLKAEAALIDNMFSGLSGIINSISAMFIAFSLAIGILSMAMTGRKGPEKVMQAAIIIGAAMLVMAASIAIIANSIKSLTMISGGGRMAKVMNPDTVKEISNVIWQMSVFVTAISGAIGLLAILPDMNKVMVATAAMSLTMVVLGVVLKIIVSSLKDTAEQMVSLGTGQLANAEAAFGPRSIDVITRIIQGMSIFILAVSAAIAGLAMLPTSSTEIAIVTGLLAGIMLVISASIAIIMKSIEVFLTKTKGFKGDVVAKKLYAVAGTVLIMIGAMVTIVASIAGIAMVFDKIGDPSAITKSLMTAGIALLGLMGFIALLSLLTVKKQLPKLKDLTGIIAVLSVVSGIFISMAAVVYILGKTDWSNADTSMMYMISFMAFASVLVIILSTLGKGLNGAVGGMLALTAVILALGALAIAIGYGANLFATAIGNIKNALANLDDIDWSAAGDAAKKMAGCIWSLYLPLALAGILSIGALLFGTALKNIVSAFDVFSKMEPSTIEAVTDIMKYFAQSMADMWGPLLVATAAALLFGAIGPSLAVGMVGLLIAGALLPTVVNLIDQGIKALAAAMPSIMSSVESMAKTIGESVDKIMAAIPSSKLQEFGEWTILLAADALLLAVGGVLLLVGAVSLMASGFILSMSAPILEKAFQELGYALTYLDIEDIQGSGGLLIFSIMLSLAGAVLAGGSIALAIGAGLLLVAAIALSYATSWLEDTDMVMIGIKIGALVLIGVETAIAGLLLSGGSIALALGAGLLLVAAIALQYASSWLAEFDPLVIADKIGWMALVSIEIAVVGALLSLGAGLLMIGSVELLIASLSLFGALYFVSQMDTSSVDTLAFIVAALVTALLPAPKIIINALLFTAAAALLLAGGFLLNKATTQFIKSLSGVILMQTIIKPLETFSKKFSSSAGILLLAAGEFAIFSGILLAGGLTFKAAAFIIMEGMAMLAQAAEYAENIAESFRAIGQNMIGGLVEGIEGASDIATKPLTSLVSTIKNVFTNDRDGFGIHSPSEWFKSIGRHIINGLKLGTDETRPQMIKSMENTVDSVCDKFAGMGEGIKNIAKEAGIDAGNLLEGGILDGIGDTVKKGLPAMGKFADGIKGLFGSFERSQIDALKRQNKILSQQAQDLSQDIGKATNFGLTTINVPGFGNMSVSQATEELKKVNEALSSNIAVIRDFEKTNGTSTDAELSASGLVDTLLDMLKAPSTSGGGTDTGVGLPEGTTAATDAALSGAGSSGSMPSTAASVGNNVGNTITTNNNYNFIQNNYSPEPIDRTELYTQTENQHYTWYKWLRDNG